MNDIGTMSCKLEVQLTERVLPWLFDKVEMFMHSDNEITQNTHELIETGIRKQ